MNAAQRTPWRVLYLDHTAKWSGGEIALLRALTALDRSRVEPIVLLAEEGKFADRLREAGIETHLLPLSEAVRETRKDTLGVAGLAGKAGAALAIFAYARRVADFARANRIDLLHCNSLKSDFYGALAGKRARLPVIWHVRDRIDPGYLPGPVVRLFRALARRWPTFVIANSDSTLETLGAPVNPRRSRTVYDGLSADELLTPEPTPRTVWRHDPPRIGMVGRLVEWKGQHVFLEAARRLTEAGVEARYVLIGAAMFGEEAYVEQLKIQAESLGPRVEFLGFRSDVPTLVRELDIMVHASISPEPFGQVVIEGMAEGVPVVASDGGGVREIVTDDEDGLLTPMGDADALAEALRGLLQSPGRGSRMARAGWRKVRAAFTAERTARGLESVYDLLMSTAVPSGRPGSSPAASAASVSEKP